MMEIITLTNKSMKLKDQKNKCWHSEDYKYEDDVGDENCEKCEKELKS